MPTTPPNLFTLARRSDPHTSRLAASKMVTTGALKTHAAQVLAHVSAHPGDTAAEIGAATGLGHIEAQRRLSGLCNEGHVVKGAARVCRVKGNRMVTWEVAR